MRIALLPLFLASPLAAQSLCDGRYDAAATILDAAYGKYDTLYSGGDHWHIRDNIGATLDVWRLLQGYPDLNLRRADQLHHSFTDDPLAGEETLHQLFATRLPLLLDPATHSLSDEDTYILATTADLITSLGPTPAWWLTQDSGPLSEVEQQTRAFAQTEPIVAWLQTTLAVSDAPWAYGWHLSGYLSSTDRDWLNTLNQDARARDGLPWTVATALALHSDRGQLASLSEDLSEPVFTCTATPAEYAAHAIILLAGLRDGVDLRADDANALPPELRRIAFENLTRRTLAYWDWNREQRPFPINLNALANDLAQPWFNVALTYRAASITELINIHDSVPLHPYSFRALNALSADNLIQFANAPGRAPDDRALLIRAAFTRLYALERDAAAQALLPLLRDLHPDHTADIEAITSTLWPRDVQLAMILLALPDMTAWITPPEGNTIRTRDVHLIWRHRTARGIDLPAEYRNGQFLQRDLETYLRLPNRWGEFFGMRGASIGLIDRAHDRNITTRHTARTQSIIASSPDDHLLPFHTLIAWQELAALSPQSGAADRAARTIVIWADARTDTWLERFFAPQDEMATALRQIVLAARHNEIGDLDGKPLARHAYELLHYRLYDSPATWETRRWHLCTQACEN